MKHWHAPPLPATQFLTPEIDIRFARPLALLVVDFDAACFVGHFFELAKHGVVIMRHDLLFREYFPSIVELPDLIWIHDISLLVKLLG